MVIIDADTHNSGTKLSSMLYMDQYIRIGLMSTCSVYVRLDACTYHILRYVEMTQSQTAISQHLQIR